MLYPIILGLGAYNITTRVNSSTTVLVCGGEGSGGSNHRHVGDGGGSINNKKSSLLITTPPNPPTSSSSPSLSCSSLPSPSPRRTVNLLLAALRGVRLVSAAWVYDSLQEGAWRGGEGGALDPSYTAHLDQFCPSAAVS